LKGWEASCPVFVVEMGLFGLSFSYMLQQESVLSVFRPERGRCCPGASFFYFIIYYIRKLFISLRGNGLITATIKAGSSSKPGLYLLLIYPLTKRKTAMTKEKFFSSMGWAGMVTSILMYVFYFPQIQNNLAGHKGTFIQPFMAGINCTLWVAYGFFKNKRDWPIVIANLPGIFFGYVAAFTAL